MLIFIIRTLMCKWGFSFSITETDTAFKQAATLPAPYGRVMVNMVKVKLVQNKEKLLNIIQAFFTAVSHRKLNQGLRQILLWLQYHLPRVPAVPRAGGGEEEKKWKKRLFSQASNVRHKNLCPPSVHPSSITLRPPPPGFWSWVDWRALVEDKSLQMAKLQEWIFLI